MMLAALSSLSILAHGQTSATDFLKDVQVSGFLDFYYQFSGNQPTPGGFGQPAGSGSYLTLRNFDVRHDSFSLAAAYLSVVKSTTADNPFGFTLNLLYGKDADIETAGEPNDPNGTKFLHQAYVTYAGPAGLTVDLGKFQTWVGLESPFAAFNDLYSLSFVFSLGQPTYHAGVRVTKPFGGTTVGLYGVNGWNEAEDSNRSKSYGASVSHTFGKVTAVANYYGGNEGSNGNNGFYLLGAGTPIGQSNLQLGDLILTSQITPKIKLSANADYGSLSRVSGDGSAGHYASYQVVGRYQATRSFGVSARYDNFWDYDGLRTASFGVGVPDARLNSGAIAFDLTTGTASTLRFEVRHDESNRQVFESDDANGRRSRTTYTLAHIFRF